MVRIYLDTNIWCRPFDAPSDKVNREKNAFYKILEKVGKGKYEIIGSIILEEEAREIKELVKRDAVEKSINEFVARRIDYVPKGYKEIMAKTKLKVKDAVHIASAIEGNAEYFISVDDEILSRAKEIEKLCGVKVRNPLKFVEE